MAHWDLIVVAVLSASPGALSGAVPNWPVAMSVSGESKPPILLASRAGLVPPRTPKSESGKSETIRSEPVSSEPASADPSSVDPEVRWLESILRTKGVDATVRRGAAERLLRSCGGARSGLRSDEDAVAALAAALSGDGSRDGEEAAAGAVVEAIQSVGSAPAGLALPLIDFAMRLPADRRDGVRGAAARLEGEAVNLVAPLASSPSQDMPRRLAAVWLLGSMRDAESIDALAALLDVANDQPAPIVDAACDQLERALDRGFGRDPEKWRRWWAELPAEASAPGQRSLMASLRARILDLESRVDRQQREVDEVAARIAAVTGELFLTLPQEVRQERTIKLLSDPLAVLRDFALTQVDRMLRNGEVPSETVQLAMLERLGDPRAEIRTRALKLLGDIGRPQLSEEISPAFVVERDPDVLKVHLALLQRQPSPATFERLVALLDEDSVSEDVARAIVRLVEDDLLHGPWQERLRDVARRLVDATPSPSFVRLLGASGDDDDLRRIEAMMTSGDPAIRRGAADALRLRGLGEKLVPLAGDEAVYPALVRAIADAPVDLARLRRVLAIAPPSPASEPDREAAVRRIVAALPATDLLAADDLLAETPWASERLRADGLARIAEVPVDDLPVALRRDALLRLGELLARSGDPRRALVVLDRLGATNDAAVDRVRFEAALVDRQFDRAATLSGEPTAWLDLLDSLVQRQNPSCPAIRDELVRRFGGVLSENDLTRLTAASAKIDGMRRDSRPVREGNG